MFGTKCCIVLLVFLALCACLITVITVVSADDRQAHYQEGAFRHKQLVQATLNWRTARLHGLGRRIPIVTVETRSDEAFLPVLGVKGLQMCNVGVHGEFVSMLSKAEMLLDWLDDQLSRYRDDLVIVMDAGDVLYGGCEVDRLLAAYKRISRVTGGAIIAGAKRPVKQKEEADHHVLKTPKLGTPERYAKLHERKQTLLKDFNLADDPWHLPKAAPTSNSSNSANASRPSSSPVNDTAVDAVEASPHEFMDMGFLLGPVGAMHALFSYVVKTVPPDTMANLKGFFDATKREGEKNDEDVAAMYMFNNPEEVTLDYAMGIISSLNEMPKKLVKVKGGKLWNQVNKAEQCFTHLNGDSGIRIGQMVERLTHPPQGGEETDEDQPLEAAPDSGDVIEGEAPVTETS